MGKDPFRIQVSPEPLPDRIEPGDFLFSIGSCFSVHLVDILKKSGVRVLSNPAGIHYHPIPMARFLDRLARGHTYTEDDLIKNGDTFVSPDHHGSFSGTDPEALLAKINLSFREAGEHISKSRYAIITPATARAFTSGERDDGLVWANCHRFPSRYFQSNHSSEEEVFQALALIRSSLLTLNPKITPIWSVSPVKHLREGIVESVLSRARIVSAIHRLIQLDTGNLYFPSYEIMTEELRDYRFYQEDMAHPSDQARDFIIGRFCETSLSERARECLTLWNRLERDLNHIPRDPTSSGTGRHLESVRNQLEELETRFPGLDTGPLHGTLQTGIKTAVDFSSPRFQNGV